MAGKRPYSSGLLAQKRSQAVVPPRTNPDQRSIPVAGSGGSGPTGPAGGDLAGTYPDPTLAVIGSATGPIGDSTHVAQVTIDAKGRVTALSSVAISTSGFPYFNVVDYGADPTGVGNSQTGVNAAIAALNSAGRGLLYFPAGTYNITGATTDITVPCEIAGQGEQATSVQQNDGSSNVLNVNSATGVHIHDIYFSGGGGTGYCVNLKGPGTFNIYTKINNCSFVAAVRGVNMEDAASTTITSCTFGCDYGSVWNCPTNPDQGAGSICDCTITSTVCGILQQSSDGLIVMGNHIIGGDYAYRMEFPDTLTLVDLWLIGNHVENQGVASFSFDGPATSGSFSGIVINGNEFAYGAGAGPVPLIDFSPSAYGGWVSVITITGNVMSCGTAYAIDLQNADGVSITGNVFNGSSVAVNIAASCSNGFVTTTNVYKGGCTLTNTGGFA